MTETTTGRPSCAELVETIKGMKPRAADRLLGKMAWLDEIVDCDGAAEFTGLKPQAVRSYHGQGRRKRAAGRTDVWSWPEPDVTLGGHPGWKLRTLVLARAAMPGRGAGGGRPWPKQEAS